MGSVSFGHSFDLFVPDLVSDVIKDTGDFNNVVDTVTQNLIQNVMLDLFWLRS